MILRRERQLALLFSESEDADHLLLDVSKRQQQPEAAVDDPVQLLVRHLTSHTVARFKVDVDRTVALLQQAGEHGVGAEGANLSFR